MCSGQPQTDDGPGDLAGGHAEAIVATGIIEPSSVLAMRGRAVVHVDIAAAIGSRVDLDQCVAVRSTFKRTRA